MSRSRSMIPIPQLAEYTGGDGNPVIVEVFTPGRGWTRQSMRKRASVAWLRKLAGEGATTVSIGYGGTHDGGRSFNRGADFRIAELLASARAAARTAA